VEARPHHLRADAPKAEDAPRLTPNNPLVNPLHRATGTIGGYARDPKAPSTRGSASDSLPIMGVQYAAVRGPRAVS
jgi:hypothetical protein